MIRNSLAVSQFFSQFYSSIDIVICAVGMFCHLSFCHGKAGVVGAAARGHCEERSKEQYQKYMLHNVQK